MPIQGVPDRKGKRENRQIVSADSDAFESYGLKKAQTSPISRGAAERFAKSLNALLRSELHHKLVGNVVYAFWSRAGIVRMLPFEPEFADTATVRDLLDFIRKGERWRTGLPDEEKFHIVGLSANVTRVVVRTHLDTTIGNLAKRQAEWFERLEIVGPNGDLGAPLSLKQLAVAPYRDFKDIAPGVEDALVRAALHSDPLPETLLRAVVMRCRLDAERRVTYPRAALLKYILTQHIVDPLEASTMNQEVTDSDRLPFDTPGERTAYHCGRLFAELEDVQRQALPGINATISDRYFGAASSAPASVFGLLLSGARDHLGKLRKTREGAYIGAERRLEEVLSEIGTFPKTLPLREQALFSLGYYHHKAAKRRDIADRAAAKRQAGQITTDDAAPQGAAAAAETVEE